MASDIMKYVLLGVGGYLLYNAYQSGALAQFGLTPAGAAPPNNTGGGGPTATNSGPNNTNPSAPLPTGGGGTTAAPPPTGTSTFLTPAQIDDLTKKAAAGDMVAAAQVTGLGIKYSGHQWNYFRIASGKSADSSPAFMACPNDDMSQPGAGFNCLMTAAEFLAARAKAGLSGVVSLGSVPLGNLVVRGWRN